MLCDECKNELLANTPPWRELQTHNFKTPFGQLRFPAWHLRSEVLRKYYTNDYMKSSKIHNLLMISNASRNLICSDIKRTVSGRICMGWRLGERDAQLNSFFPWRWTQQYTRRRMNKSKRSIKIMTDHQYHQNLCLKTMTCTFSAKKNGKPLFFN